MPANSTIYALRNKIHEDTGIPFHLTRLKINRTILLSREIEEFYDVSSIKQRDVYIRMDDNMRKKQIDNLRDKFKDHLGDN
jgi:hypothetical protein